ncbi:hypothetical protein [uncultured Reyranella sp.]|uniref:hypothetical protein n=1 Tax=uncultured Reyranella sp. TaxID=735512 RepID=UPI0025FB93FC|nr:hypothetical protein [uncultured Reyranella sp.]
MRIAAIFVALSALCAAAPASAQGYGLGGSSGPKIGDLEIKAYQKIPKAKIAVQLTSDTHLARELRRQVMVRLTQRGNQVGFSGGNIMRMDVSYFDLSGGGLDRDIPLIQSQDYETGANPRLALPANPIGRRDTIPPAPSGSTLRVSLTLYESNSGKVLWTATGSCSVRSSAAMQAGLSIVNHIFDGADANRVADAGCPI